MDDIENTNTPLHALLVEDSENDALLVVRTLRQGGYDLTYEKVQTPEAMRAALDQKAWDVIIADYSMPRFSGLAALKMLQDSDLDLPFIVVSGTIGEKVAVSMMRAGAHDYLMKDNLARLVPAVQRELREAQVRRARQQAEAALRASEERFRRMAEGIRDGLTIIENGRVAYVNDRMCEILGRSREELYELSGLDVAAPEERERLQEIMTQSQRTGEPPQELEFWIIRKDGTRRCIHNRYTAKLLGNGQVDRYVVTTDITQRKRMEEALREREELYSALVERAYDGIVLVQDQKIVYANPRLSEILGDYQIAEMLNTHFSHYIHPDELEKVTDYYQRRMTGQAVPPRYETALVSKAGKRIDVELNAGVITYRDQPADFVLVRNISERKRAERLLEALNQAALAMERALTPQEIFDAVEAAFKKLGLTCAVLRTDEHQERLLPIYLSHKGGAVKAAEKLVGLQAKVFSIPIDNVELYRKIVRERQTILVQDTAAVTAQLLPRAVRPLARQLVKILNVPRFIGAPLIVKDRVIGMFSVESADLTQEDVPAVTAFAHQMAAAWRKAQLFEQAQLEIAERKRAEAEREQLLAQIQGQAQQMQHIVDTVPEGVLLLDAQRRVVLANPPAQTHLAALATTDPGDDTLTHLGDRPLAELLAAPPLQPWHAVERGDKRFQVIARPLEDQHQTEGWVMVIRDVTREHEIQQRAQQQERLAAVGQLAAGIAHDFNNIMAVIMLYTQMALKQPELPTKTRERLETISQQAWRATELIQQVLDFGRRTVIERRSVDLLPFLKEHVKLLQRTLPENIQIELAHGADDYTIDADLTRIQQAIMNLALNARDAMPQGGQLQIELGRIRVAEDGRGPLPEMTAGEWVQLTVADSGTGIPPDLLPRIFDPFVTTKASGQGSGLGLAQVHGIVKLHGGEIDVASQVGQGTTFTLYFPTPATPTAEKLDDEIRHLVYGAGETILVVEDETATREALIDSLELLGYRALAATNGQEALDLLTARAEEVALLLSDVVMPQMGGIDLLQALQEQSIQIKTLLLSGHPMQNELENLHEQGVIDWLSKPPTLDGLSRAVAEALAV